MTTMKAPRRMGCSARAAHTRLSRTRVAVLLALLLPVAAHALSVAVPADHATLQAAINAVQGTADARVTVNSNSVFAENLQIARGIDIEAGPGFTPVIRPASGVPFTIEYNSTTPQGFTLRGLKVESSGVGSTYLVDMLVRNTGIAELTVDRMNFSNPAGEPGVVGILLRSLGVADTASKRLNVRNSEFAIDTAPDIGGGAVTMYGGAGPSWLEITDSIIRTTGAATGVEVRGARLTPLVATTVVLRNNSITTAAPNGSYSSGAVVLLDDVASTIDGNRFNFVSSGAANSSTGGIQITGKMDNALNIVERNHFVGSGAQEGYGVSFTPYANSSGAGNPPTSGQLIFRNNVLRNVQSGLQLNPQSGDTASVFVIHNTIDTATTCLAVYANDNASVTGEFSNNLCTHISGGTYAGEGMVPLPAGAVKASAGTGAAISLAFNNNGYFANNHGNYAPTVVTVPNVGETFNADPRYANPAIGDLRLQVGSPAIDAGSATGILNDNAGAVRPQGAAPDIGAYEGGVPAVVVGGSSPVAIPTLSNAALGALAGLMLLAAAGVHARRRG